MHYLGEFESFNDAYHPIVQAIKRDGTLLQPRGMLCRELRPACFTLKDARLGLFTGQSRRLNYGFWAIETLQYLAGWGWKVEHAELLCAINSNVARFRNVRTRLFDGAYGVRLVESLPYIIRLLERDPDSRQAVASIWTTRPPDAGSVDVPCTLSLHFYQTLPQTLGATATMRSNDSNWGLPYDVAAFCAIQCQLASVLGWTLGSYTHVDGSLHTYEASPPSIEAPSCDRHIPLAMPLWLARVSFNVFKCEAELFLEHACRHFVRCGFKAKNFECPKALETSTYWQEWSIIVRFTWSVWNSIMVGDSNA